MGSPLNRWNRRFVLRPESGARVRGVEKLEGELGVRIPLSRESGCRSVKVPRVTVVLIASGPKICRIRDFFVGYLMHPCIRDWTAGDGLAADVQTSIFSGTE